jgi:xanthine dehydrogenase accessory factor
MITSINTEADWLDASLRLKQRKVPFVLVTVLGARGSTPRDTETKMVFTDEESFGSIGGGNLEFQVGNIAQEMLQESSENQRIEYFQLGPSLGQCCGGSCSVLFEVFRPSHLNLAIFGAGHVGQTLVGILESLPINIFWVDSRMETIKPKAGPSVKVIQSDEPKDEITNMPVGSSYLIMTHNHQLDYDLLCSVINRGDAAYIGIIGSDTKWRKFKARLAHQGYKPESYAGVFCPVGLRAITGKRPMEVAISIAAQLIQHRDSKAEKTAQRGLHWKTLSETAKQLSESNINGS